MEAVLSDVVVISEGSLRPSSQILRCAQDDSLDLSQVRSRVVFSPNVWSSCPL